MYWDPLGDDIILAYQKPDIMCSMIGETNKLQLDKMKTDSSEELSVLLSGLREIQSDVSNEVIYMNL